MKLDRIFWIAGLIFLSAALAVISQMAASGGRYGQCVVLPNGMNLGYESRIQVGNKWGKPFIVPKFSDGTPLLHGEIWPFYATKTTLYGTFTGRDRDQNKSFVWREDIGMVFWRVSPELFEELRSQAGSLIEGVVFGGFDTGWYYRKLAGNPRFGLHDCRTKFIAW